eukprot:gene12467-8551_t
MSATPPARKPTTELLLTLHQPHKRKIHPLLRRSMDSGTEGAAGSLQPCGPAAADFFFFFDIALRHHAVHAVSLESRARSGPRRQEPYIPHRKRFFGSFDKIHFYYSACVLYALLFDKLPVYATSIVLQSTATAAWRNRWPGGTAGADTVQMSGSGSATQCMGAHAAPWFPMEAPPCPRASLPCPSLMHSCCGGPWIAVQRAPLCIAPFTACLFSSFSLSLIRFLFFVCFDIALRHHAVHAVSLESRARSGPVDKNHIYLIENVFLVLLIRFIFIIQLVFYTLYCSTSCRVLQSTATAAWRNRWPGGTAGADTVQMSGSGSATQCMGAHAAPWFPMEAPPCPRASLPCPSLMHSCCGGPWIAVQRAPLVACSPAAPPPLVYAWASASPPPLFTACLFSSFSLSPTRFFFVCFDIALRHHAVHAVSLESRARSGPVDKNHIYLIENVFLVLLIRFIFIIQLVFYTLYCSTSCRVLQSTATAAWRNRWPGGTAGADTVQMSGSGSATQCMGAHAAPWFPMEAPPCPRASLPCPSLMHSCCGGPWIAVQRAPLVACSPAAPPPLVYAWASASPLFTACLFSSFSLSPTRFLFFVCFDIALRHHAVHAVSLESRARSGPVDKNHIYLIENVFLVLLIRFIFIIQLVFYTLYCSTSCRVLQSTATAAWRNRWPGGTAGADTVQMSGSGSATQCMGAHAAPWFPMEAPPCPRASLPCPSLMHSCCGGPWIAVQRAPLVACSPAAPPPLVYAWASASPLFTACLFSSFSLSPTRFFFVCFDIVLRHHAVHAVSLESRARSGPRRQEPYIPHRKRFFGSFDKIHFYYSACVLYALLFDKLPVYATSIVLQSTATAAWRNRWPGGTAGADTVQMSGSGSATQCMGAHAAPWFPMEAPPCPRASLPCPSLMHSCCGGPWIAVQRAPLVACSPAAPPPLVYAWASASPPPLYGLFVFFFFPVPDKIFFFVLISLCGTTPCTPCPWSRVREVAPVDKNHIYLIENVFLVLLIRFIFIIQLVFYTLYCSTSCRVLQSTATAAWRNRWPGGTAGADTVQMSGSGSATQCMGAHAAPWLRRSMDSGTEGAAGSLQPCGPAAADFFFCFDIALRHHAVHAVSLESRARSGPVDKNHIYLIENVFLVLLIRFIFIIQLVFYTLYCSTSCRVLQSTATAAWRNRWPGGTAGADTVQMSGSGSATQCMGAHAAPWFPMEAPPAPELRRSMDSGTEAPLCIAPFTACLFSSFSLSPIRFFFFFFIVLRHHAVHAVSLESRARSGSRRQEPYIPHRKRFFGSFDKIHFYYSACVLYALLFDKLPVYAKLYVPTQLGSIDVKCSTKHSNSTCNRWPAAPHGIGADAERISHPDAWVLMRLDPMESSCPRASFIF